MAKAGVWLVMGIYNGDYIEDTPKRGLARRISAQEPRNDRRSKDRGFTKAVKAGAKIA
jgi:hypothetical protein